MPHAKGRKKRRNKGRARMLKGEKKNETRAQPACLKGESNKNKKHENNLPAVFNLRLRDRVLKGEQKRNKSTARML